MPLEGNLLRGKPIKWVPLIPAIEINRVKQQLELLHNSMLDKSVVLLPKYGKYGYVTCLSTEDGSGHCWFITLSTGVRFFVRLSEPDMVRAYSPLS